ncbi:putative bifunctional diguanylate cyclase/phosphodiesterase [Roseibium denhamense]|uniref:Diguanylate cyclase/phosphodiesterase n=1 Tax=Roseibium denhamense TaxID=76305 RepID=A0ABY1P2F7_9HYPH|nr:bifunctional diguanylate cyclase/phosphodiesterase [Roseibium denhamense]SMP23799.1 diguanylate cyclase/phosphodiesterase [Roseibium denhamense]
MIAEPAQSLQLSGSPDHIVDSDLKLFVLDQLESAVWIFDFEQKRILWANQAALNVYDAQSLDDLRSRDLAADMSHSVELRLKQYQQDFSQSNVRFSEIWTLYPKGKARVLQMTMSGVRLTDGRLALLCEGREHHEQQPETLRSAEALLHTTVMISLFSLDGNPLYRNTASRSACIGLEASFGDQFVNPKEAKELWDSVAEERSTRRVAQVRTNSGHRWHELTLRSCHDPVSGQPAYLVSEIDVTELHETKERAQYLASHDPLTGLSNRTFLTDKLTRMLETGEAQGRTASLYLIDLDEFKLVNDNLGHSAGDELLQLVANKLRRLVGPDDIAARLGGDEFLICHMLSPNSAESPEWLGQALQTAFSSQQIIDGKPRHVSLSIGFAHYPEDGATIGDLMRNADLALYQAKTEPNTKCVRFQEDMRRVRDEQQVITQDLKRAVREDEFVLYFQPIACTRTERIVSAEALIRWQHPTKGLMMPDEFIPVAEDTGLIKDIGNWVGREVINTHCELAELSLDLPLAMNVSPRQLSDPMFVAHMQSLVDQCQCDASSIALEITENVLLGEIPNALGSLRALKAGGYRVVIDDFGTGYSNLAYLHNYPVDGIKIDRMFMEDIGSGGEIVKLILSLAKALGASVVAEGVETVQQRNWLSAHGCHWHQGYLYSKPVPKQTFVDMLKNQPGAPAQKRHVPDWSI